MPSWLFDKPVFKDKNKSKQALRSRDKEFKNFAEKRKRRPDVLQLMRGQQMSDCEVMQRFAKNITRDHWREFSRPAKISDSRDVFKYLAKSDGRQPRGFKFARAATKPDETRNKVIAPRANCRLLADYFQRKLADRNIQVSPAGSSSRNAVTHVLGNLYRASSRTFAP